MDITINTPALLFPAISLIMLAYTNRFLALANVVRNLHDRYVAKSGTSSNNLPAQLRNLKFRLRIIRNMQILGVLSFLLAIVSMYLIYIGQMDGARNVFAAALLFFMISLLLSLLELFHSTKSLEIELSDMEEKDEANVVDFLKRQITGE
jgi:hypothetical protein